MENGILGAILADVTPEDLALTNSALKELIPYEML